MSPAPLRPCPSDGLLHGRSEQRLPLQPMDYAKLMLYGQKYYGTKTKGEEYRQKQIAEWVANIIKQHQLLEELLVDDRFSEIGRFVRFEVKL